MQITTKTILNKRKTILLRSTPALANFAPISERRAICIRLKQQVVQLKPLLLSVIYLGLGKEILLELASQLRNRIDPQICLAFCTKPAMVNTIFSIRFHFITAQLLISASFFFRWIKIALTHDKPLHKYANFITIKKLFKKVILINKFVTKND